MKVVILIERGIINIAQKDAGVELHIVDHDEDLNDDPVVHHYCEDKEVIKDKSLLNDVTGLILSQNKVKTQKHT